MQSDKTLMSAKSAIRILSIISGMVLASNDEKWEHSVNSPLAPRQISFREAGGRSNIPNLSVATPGIIKIRVEVSRKSVANQGIITAADYSYPKVL